MVYPCFSVLPVTLLLLSATCLAGGSVSMPTGFKIGEVTQRTAIIWTRVVETEAHPLPNWVRVSWWPKENPAARKATDWQSPDPFEDHTCQVPLSGLDSGTDYQLLVETRAGTQEATTSLEGGFRTAPAESTEAEVTFTVVTGQRNDTRDRGDEGHAIYESMLAQRPDFFVHTGDVVYYDKPGPDARTEALARFRWNRMYAYPLQRQFHRNVGSYFIKDDHDILKDDCWPGQIYGSLTWENGLRLFAEQTPSPDRPYRTVRWGKDLQVWLLEGREFRSPNPEPDGPDKTILGAEQLAWLEQTLDASDATFRVVISATPIVGPDRPTKRDNHTNPGFQYEGKRLRKLLADRDNVYVVCGDRHWQYASNDPVTGLLEYCCGPTTDKHAGGFRETDRDPAFHRFLKIQGGYLSVTVDRPEGVPRLAFRHHSVQGAVVHEEFHAVRNE